MKRRRDPCILFVQPAGPTPSSALPACQRHEIFNADCGLCGFKLLFISSKSLTTWPAFPFLVQNGSFSAFWHCKNKERLLMGSDVKWHIPSTCLDARKKKFSIGIYSINRASERLWLETPKSPQNGQNVHGFPVRTTVCHIVPVSRAYPPPPPPAALHTNPPNPF